MEDGKININMIIFSTTPAAAEESKLLRLAIDVKIMKDTLINISCKAIGKPTDMFFSFPFWMV